MANEESDRVLTVKEAAELLKVNFRTVYGLLESGEIPGVKVGNSWRIRHSALMARLNGEPPKPSITKTRGIRLMPWLAGAAVGVGAAVLSGPKILSNEDEIKDLEKGIKEAEDQMRTQLAAVQRTRQSLREKLERLEALEKELKEGLEALPDKKEEE